jgi:hypothetical protein
VAAIDRGRRLLIKPITATPRYIRGKIGLRVVELV